MSGGNGIDIGAVYQLLSQVADLVVAHDRKLNELASGQAELRRAMAEQGAEVRRAIEDQAAGLASLRRAVTDYHSSVLGHGILITELDERVRRIEQHLNLPSIA